MAHAYSSKRSELWHANATNSGTCSPSPATRAAPASIHSEGLLTTQALLAYHSGHPIHNSLGMKDLTTITHASSIGVLPQRNRMLAVGVTPLAAATQQGHYARAEQQPSRPQRYCYTTQISSSSCNACRPRARPTERQPHAWDVLRPRKPHRQHWLHLGSNFSPWTRSTTKGHEVNCR